MTTQMGFAELLDLFTSEDLEHALRDLGDPVSGGKAERIERLVQLGNTRETEDVLESFDESALGMACLRLGVSPGDFFEMIDRLADLVRDDKGKGVGAVVVAIVGAIIGTFVSLIVGTWVFYGDPIPNIVLIVSSIGGAIGGLITRD